MSELRFVIILHRRIEWLLDMNMQDVAPDGFGSITMIGPLSHLWLKPSKMR
jgi:hypothetical protein